MSATDLLTTILYPGPIDVNCVNGSVVVLDAANETAAFCFQAKRNFTARYIEFRTGVVTTGGDVEVGIQALSASTGDPDGTYIGSAVQTIANTDDNTWFRAQMSSDVTLTVGGWYAVCIRISSYVAQNLQISTSQNGGLVNNLLYSSNYLAGTWTKVTTSLTANTILDASLDALETTVPFGVAVNIASNQTPDEIGNVFTVPIPLKICGAWAMIDLDAAGELNLYQGTTVLATATLNSVYRGATAGRLHPAPFDGGTTIELMPNTTYRVTVKGTTTTSTTFYWGALKDSGQLKGLPGKGTIYSTRRTDGEEFTDDQTYFAPIGVMLCGQTDPVYPAVGTVARPADGGPATYGWNGEYTGTRVDPAESDVRAGVLYADPGDQKEGTYTPKLSQVEQPALYPNAYKRWIG